MAENVAVTIETQDPVEAEALRAVIEKVRGKGGEAKKAALTEREILDCLKENLKIGIDCSKRLAAGERGDLYPNLREALLLVYGCTRQMAGWREDTRWAAFGMRLPELIERTRRWLVEKHPGWRYKSVAEILTHALAQAIDLETKKTGKRGAILPKPLPAPTRTEGRSILVPDGYADVRNRKEKSN